MIMPAIHYLALAPILIFLGTSLLLLFMSALTTGVVARVAATTLTVVASIAAVVCVALQWRGAETPSTTIAHALVIDRFSLLGTGLIAICVALSALVAHDWLRRSQVAGAEYHILALASAAGAMMMTSANDLVVLFLGLEILSIGLYVLVAFDRHRATSAEAALKYFLLGGFAAAIFIYGAALLYGATGSTNLTDISYILSVGVFLHPGLLLAGAALLLVGFAFKVAAVPFHMWSPDVYDGAPTPVTGFMASIVKVGAFLGFLRVIVSALGTQLDALRPVLFALIALSCVVGAVLTLAQRNVKRLLAYSSINHAGFLLLALWAGTAMGVESLSFYLLSYAPIVVATFAIVSLVGGPSDDAHGIEGYRGLGRRQPILGGILAILLLSQLGAPLTVGFIGKLNVLDAATSASGQIISLIALLSAAMTAFAYLRWVFALYDEAGESTHVEVPRATRVVLGVVVFFTLLAGVWPGPFETLAQHATVLFLP